jgi:hypothetical protein
MQAIEPILWVVVADLGQRREQAELEAKEVANWYPLLAARQPLTV